MGAYRVRLWKWFLNFSIVMIWGSVFLALVTHVLPEKVINFFSFRLGGGHGDFIRDYLITNLGSLGAWIVVLATAVFYMMYLTSETINVVRKIMNPQDFIKEKLPKRHPPKFVGNAKVEYDQKKALEGADFVYAKNWSCPGVKDPAQYGEILSKDMSWTIDEEHMSWTNDGCFMHCLPVRRGLIVTDDVIESQNSLVIPEAANREISAEVVIKRMLESL